MGVNEVDLGLVAAVLERALAHGGEFAEVYVEERDGLNLRLEDRRLEQTSGGRDFGAAVRLLDGERTFYAYSDVVDEAGLTAAADAVAAALRGGGGAAPVVELGPVRSRPGAHPVVVPPETVDIRRKADLLRAADDEARAAGGEIAQVIAAYADARQRILIANSVGELVRDDRTRTRVSVQCVARRGEVIQTGHETLGGSCGFELLGQPAVLAVARDAAGKALVMLDARPAPVGLMPVVLANGFGGTLFHEACGHGLEADAVAKDASIYAGRLGHEVAAPIVDAWHRWK